MVSGVTNLQRHVKNMEKKELQVNEDLNKKFVWK